MDAPERRRLLFEKATANNQRRRREELLRRLPPHLSNELDGSPCIYSVDIDPILRRFLPFNHEGVGSVGMAPPYYDFTEVACESKMLDLLPRLVVPRLAGKAFLLLEPPSRINFDGEEFCLPDVPIFVIDFRWAAPLLTDFWACCSRGLFLVEQDLQAGVLVDCYCGHLREDLNPTEIVYEVALWPSKPDAPDA
jgi:hypothetical protein